MKCTIRKYWSDTHVVEVSWSRHHHKNMRRERAGSRKLSEESFTLFVGLPFVLARAKYDTHHAQMMMSVRFKKIANHRL